MTVKEQIVEIIRAEGYDFVSACEMATKAIAEFTASKQARQRLTVGRTSFTIAAVCRADGH